MAMRMLLIFVKNLSVDVVSSGEVSKCCDSVCPVCFHCSVCSVFAGVAEPDDNSNSEPKSNSDHVCEVGACD